ARDSISDRRLTVGSRVTARHGTVSRRTFMARVSPQPSPFELPPAAGSRCSGSCGEAGGVRNQPGSPLQPGRHAAVDDEPAGAPRVRDHGPAWVRATVIDSNRRWPKGRPAARAATVQTRAWRAMARRLRALYSGTPSAMRIARAASRGDGN